MQWAQLHPDFFQKDCFATTEIHQNPWIFRNFTANWWNLIFCTHNFQFLTWPLYHPFRYQLRWAIYTLEMTKWCWFFTFLYPFSYKRRWEDFLATSNSMDRVDRSSSVNTVCWEVIWPSIFLTQIGFPFSCIKNHLLYLFFSKAVATLHDFFKKLKIYLKILKKI